SRQPRGTGRVREPNVVADPLSEELTKLAAELETIGSKLPTEEEKIEFTAVAGRARALALGVQQWLGQALEGQGYWVEVRTERQPRVSLASAPIEVGPALKEQLYDKVPTVVMTSATLSVGGTGGFRHAQARLGLTECQTKQLGSPFDYKQQAELHLFRSLP